MKQVKSKQFFFLEEFYIKTIKRYLINKYKYTHISGLPLLKKIVLSFGSNTTQLEQISSSMLAFKIICGQKAKITRAKKANIVLKIRKGNPSGCVLTLQKSIMFCNLEKNIFNILYKSNLLTIVKSNKLMKQNSLSYKLKKALKLQELEKHYYYFTEIGSLDISIVTTKTQKNELSFILKSCQFPLLEKNNLSNIT